MVWEETWRVHSKLTLSVAFTHSALKILNIWCSADPLVLFICRIFTLFPLCFFQLERGDFLSEEWKERIANTRWYTKFRSSKTFYLFPSNTCHITEEWFSLVINATIMKHIFSQLFECVYVNSIICMTLIKKI